MNLLPFAVAWVLLGIAVLVLAMMRRSITAHEDDSLHVLHGEAVINEQVNVAKKLDAIDKWGKLLTIILVATGLVLAIFYGMQVWEASSKVGLA